MIGNWWTRILRIVTEIEKHFHNHEHWRGLLAVPTATNWFGNNLTPFRAVSGADTYGAVPGDEALVVGSADTPISAGMVKYDPYRISIEALSTDTPWKLRLVYGTGTMAEAITAEQFSEVMASNIVTGSKSGGTPLEFRMPRLDVGTQLWLQAWNATLGATCDFFIGIHEYVE